MIHNTKSPQTLPRQVGRNIYELHELPQKPLSKCCLYVSLYICLYCAHLVQLLIQDSVFMESFLNNLFILQSVVIESMVVTEQIFYNSNFLGIMYF